MKHYSIPAITAALLLIACQKTVTLKLNSVPPGIDIQGNVTDAPGPYTVSIQRSVAFYADNSYPAISGAMVKISDDMGNTDNLTETSPGVYSTHTLQGTPGHTYTMTAQVNDTLYTATSTMPQPVALDSITFQRGAIDNKQINAIANFQDPAGVKNYYQFFQAINGVPFTKDIFIFDDRLSDGRYINNTLRMDSSYLQVGNTLTVTMNCVDSTVYNYFLQLASSSGAGGNTASPANPTTNISNGAYGYFSAHTTTSKQIVVY